MFDHFVGLALKGLILEAKYYFANVLCTFNTASNRYVLVETKERIMLLSNVDFILIKTTFCK